MTRPSPPVFALILLTTLTPATVVRAEDSRKKPLEGFDAVVDKAIKDFKVPGLAIAVVKDGAGHLRQGLRPARRRQGTAGHAQDPLRHRLVHQGVHHVRDGDARRRGEARVGYARADVSPRLPDERPDRDRVDHPARPGDASLRPAPPRHGLVQHQAHRQGRRRHGWPTSKPPSRSAASSSTIT